MTEIFARLPPALITGVVVAVFFALQRQNPSVRVRLWLAAWVMMLLRFVIFMLPDNWPPPGLLNNILGIVGTAALDLAGLLFLVSLTSKLVHYPKARTWMLVSMGVPILAYTTLEIYNSQRFWAYAVCVAVLLIGGVLWEVVWMRKYPVRVMVVVGVVVVVGVATMYETLRGNLNFSDNAIPGVLFALSAFFFARLYRRWTPGVVTTVFGFIYWSAIFPGIYYVVARNINISGEFWNVPKFFVAFGMVQTLLEDQSFAAGAAVEREHAVKEQVQRFAATTSKLLGGANVRTMGNEIAQAITEATAFDRAVLLLSNEQRQLYIAGHSGVDAAVLRELESAVQHNSPDLIVEMCANSEPVGSDAFRCHREKAKDFGSVASTRKYRENPNWREGDELIVPLRSRRGTFVGAISLDQPRDPERVTAADLSPLGMFATDIAVAVENSELHRQLLISEKLAGIGQLVSGMTHELNNPLTAVMGYAEVLEDQVRDEDAKKYVGIVRRESMRMKRIIENLLRFARQHKQERKLIELQPLLDEIIQLRGYESRSKGVQVVSEIDANLPRISGDENQLRQVFLNVLNNAFDAVDDAQEKRVTIEARAEESKVVLRFMDSGCGFKDLDRVFDPFFTTKAIGKGTGLGLSLCYGIMKEHGGEIYAANLKPGGACITMEFPLQAAVSASVSA